MKNQLNLSIHWSIHLVTRMAKAISGHTTAFFYQLLISGNNMQKSRLFHYFVLEIYLIWNPAVWLANTILALYDWETN